MANWGRFWSRSGRIFPSCTMKWDRPLRPRSLDCRQPTGGVPIYQLYDSYQSCNLATAWLLVLSAVFFPSLASFFLFADRKKEGGRAPGGKGRQQSDPGFPRA